MERPLSPTDLKHFLELKAQRYDDKGWTCSEKQKGLLAGMLGHCVSGEKADRYAVTEWLTGETSLNDQSDGMLLAMLDWVSVEAHESGYQPGEFAIKEAQSVLRVAMEAQGQKSFLV